jgi:hypothetical protein
VRKVPELEGVANGTLGTRRGPAGLDTERGRTEFLRGDMAAHITALNDELGKTSEWKPMSQVPAPIWLNPGRRPGSIV